MMIKNNNSLKKHLDLSQTRVKHLEDITSRYYLGLEIMAYLRDMHKKIKKPLQPSVLFQPTLYHLKQLIPFMVSGFCIVNPKDMSFSLSECDPPEKRFLLQKEIDRQIDEGNFAWALGKNRAFVITPPELQYKVIFHPMVAKSKVVGLFIGMPFHFESRKITLERQNLLSNILSNVVRALENSELFYLLNRQNQQLENIVKKRNKELEQQSRQLKKEIENKKRMKNRIKHLTYYDSITGLPNRTLTRDRLSMAIAESNRTQNIVVVIRLGLRDFKAIVESLGQGAGDIFLKEMAQRIIRALRKGATVGHTGRDEFTILISELTQKSVIEKVVQKIFQNFKRPVTVNQHKIFPKFSVGLALYPQDGKTPESLLINADRAMEYAKTTGNKEFQYYKPRLHSKAKKKMIIENALREALDCNEFILYYQPKIDSRSNRIVGMEALMRWQSSQLGFVSPSLFIPVAEETRLIFPIGEWELRTACRQIKSWVEEKIFPINLAVNLSGTQCNQPELVELIKPIIEETGIDPRYLELEITETVLMENLDIISPRLKEFSDMGIQLSIDDFGTGYSSLSYLKNLPIDILKIDKSFIHGLFRKENETNASITKAIIYMAKSLNLKTCAEGVEHQKEHDILRALGCDYLQGYFYSKPLPLDQMTTLLKDQSKVFPSQVI